MMTVAVLFWASTVMVLVGVGWFVYYLRSRKGWAWGVSVALMSLGITGLTLWWR